MKFKQLWLLRKKQLQRKSKARWECKSNCSGYAGSSQTSAKKLRTARRLDIVNRTS